MGRGKDPKIIHITKSRERKNPAEFIVKNYSAIWEGTQLLDWFGLPN